MCQYNQTCDKNDSITFQEPRVLDWQIRRQDCAFSAGPTRHLQFNEEATQDLDWLH